LVKLTAIILGALTLSFLSDIYVRQCTIQADGHIRPGTAGSSEIIVEGRIKVQQKITKMDSLIPRIEVMQRRIMGWNVIWIERGERIKCGNQIQAIQ